MIERNLRKEWFGYVPLSVGRDEEWIRMAAKSGCRLLLIGVESEKTEQLSRVGKKMRSGPSDASIRHQRAGKFPVRDGE